MSLSASTRLGPYEILAPIGAGGMGEVYRARDTRLERIVAIKVLSAAFVSAPSLKERFEREAKTISQLSHPHICQLYDVGVQDGVDFLVMEFIEGETIGDRLQRGAMPPHDVLRLGIQIADALDKAHQMGVVHRDLKPGNIMLTKQGVKVLDFGLAKQSQAAAISASAMTAMTTGKALTAEGTIVGTFQYMAPEQLEGSDADTRSDIFALGCVLYEMTTGKSAFGGKTQASVIASILASQPEPLSTAAPMTPPALERVIRSCLVKEKDDRLQSAHDLKLQLEWISEAGSMAGVPAPEIARRRTSKHVAWAIAAVATLVAIAFAVAFVLRAPVAPAPLRASISMADKQVLDPFGMALSPDGTKLAYVGSIAEQQPQLFIRALDSVSAQALAGTEGANFPFWSPDSRKIGFFAAGKLRTIDAAGGAVETLADVGGARGGSWGQDGTILFTPNPGSPILRMPVSGGVPVPAISSTAANKLATQRWPTFLPDNRHFLYWTIDANSAGAISGTMFVGDLQSSDVVKLGEANSGAAFAHGYILFIREGNLLAQKFDTKRLALQGEAVRVAEQVQTDGRGAAAFSVSQDDKLIFDTGQSATMEMAFYDRAGKKGAVIDTGTFQDAYVSPDQKKVAASRADPAGHLELYIYDLARGTKSQFTFSQSRDDDPIWSPDQNTIVFDSARNGVVDMYTKPANGSRQEELLYHDDLGNYPSSWSADGKYLVYETLSKGHFGIGVLPMFGERKPLPYFNETYTARFPVLSPDGKWLSYTSFESGHPQVYLTAFPVRGGKFLVADGAASQWSGNGKELFYIDERFRVTVVEVTQKGDSVELGRPQTLFTAGASGTGVFHVTKDGKKFLMMRTPDQTSTAPTLVVNWPQELKK